jgi:hypothetical protein
MFSKAAFLFGGSPRIKKRQDSGAEVKIELGEEPSFLSIEGKIGNKDLVKALNLVVEHQAEFLEKWREIHE